MNLSKYSYFVNIFLQLLFQNLKVNCDGVVLATFIRFFLHFIWNFNKFKTIGFDSIIIS
jgi:hypothetical protein